MCITFTGMTFLRTCSGSFRSEIVKAWMGAIVDKFMVRNINYAYIKWGIKDGDGIT